MGIESSPEISPSSEHTPIEEEMYQEMNDASFEMEEDNDGLFTDDDNDNYDEGDDFLKENGDSDEMDAHQGEVEVSSEDDEGDDFLNENGDSDEMDAHQGEVEVGREDNGFFTDDGDNLEQASDENFIEEESSGSQGEFLDR